MAVIRCKICGGDLNVVDETTVAVCEYCGTRQTLPKVNDEQRAAAFNRGDHFRKISEFDKALSVYERIIAEDDTDAEAHWCAALSRYGIEYVKDPASGKYIPTCHRASYTNFLDDVDYQTAVTNADPIAREQYEQDGRIIAEVQRNIIETVNKEAPFDVFICYKENDDRGQRTLDSTLAQDIYYRLTDQGYRVFFSRITLEDKAGQQYEPYIFAALHSAKVMIVIGTRPEFMNAVWVKNEWSRYLALMKNDRSRLLIPCYRDMDPYDMPEQLSVLQSYDMSRIGFIQDLIRGISKVLEAEKPKEKETVIVQTNPGNTSLDVQIKRGYFALEDCEFTTADNYFDHALDIDPESAEAYLGKVLAHEQCKDYEAFIKKHCNTNNRKKTNIYIKRDFEKSIEQFVKKYYVKNYLSEYSIRSQFKTDSLSFESETESIEQILRVESEYLDKNNTLNRACRLAKNDNELWIKNIKKEILSRIKHELAKEKTKDEASYQKIIHQYEQDFEVSNQNAYNLYQQALQKKETEYQEACLQMERVNTITKCTEIIKEFKRIDPEYKDAANRINQLEKTINRMRNEEKQRFETQKRLEAIAKRKKNCTIIICISLFIVVFLAYTNVIRPALKYHQANSLLLSGELDKSVKIFQSLGDYGVSLDKTSQIYYSLGEKYYSEHDFNHAIDAFKQAEDYSDARLKLEKIKTQLIIDITAGNYHTVALKGNGTVVASGNSKFGQCDVSKWQDITSISAGENHTVGLRTDNTVVAVGDNHFGQCDVSEWQNIIKIDAGANHTVGLKTDNTVVSSGDNHYGQLNTSGWQNIVAIAAGYWHTVGLKSDGTVIAVGANSSGQCNVTEWRDIVAIFAGSSCTIGIKSDGTIVIAGKSSNITSWHDIIYISSAISHTVGLKSNGTVEAIGDKQYGDISKWTNITKIAVGETHTVGLKNDGTIIAAGRNFYGQCDVSEWNIQTN